MFPFPLRLFSAVNIPLEFRITHAPEPTDFLCRYIVIAELAPHSLDIQLQLVGYLAGGK